jgi:hypothetical protein
MTTIYVLKSADGSFPECYIGKTKILLCSRFAKHKYCYEHQDELQLKEGRKHLRASSPLFEKAQALQTAVIIEAIETVPDEEANTRERFYMLNTPGCINVKLSWANAKEREKNQNAKRSEYLKQYHKDNAEKLAAQKKILYEKNKERLNAYTTCECCHVPVMVRNISRHNKTAAHLKSTNIA